MLLRLGEALVGVTICEDMWQPGPPATDLALAGAQLLVNVSASPFHVGKEREREEMFQQRARDTSSFVAFVNAVGGQDELVFDGHSCVLDDEGEVLARAPGFEEALLVVDVDPTAAIGRRLSETRRRALAREQDRPPTVVELALTVPGTGRTPANGGVAPLSRRPRADAPRARARAPRLRGQERLLGDRRRSLRRDRLGADRGARRRGARRRPRPRRLDAVPLLVGGDARATRSGSPRAWGSTSARSPIEGIVGEFEDGADPSFEGRERDLTEENVQARARGVLLMALSNKFGWLVVATGNKSELSVGYATLYGDMAGGFALLKDVFKTDVFRLARHLNERAGRELIPQSIIDRAPSAELRDNQLDQDSLPPYPELDKVLEAYVELDRSREELLHEGFDAGVVDRALALIDRAEYKRRQAPPGVKLRPKAFGRDRRTPITNRWRG